MLPGRSANADSSEKLTLHRTVAARRHNRNGTVNDAVHVDNHNRTAERRLTLESIASTTSDPRYSINLYSSTPDRRESFLAECAFLPPRRSMDGQQPRRTPSSNAATDESWSSGNEAEVGSSDNFFFSHPPSRSTSASSVHALDLDLHGQTPAIVLNDGRPMDDELPIYDTDDTTFYYHSFDRDATHSNPPSSTSVSNRTTTTNQSMPPSLCPDCDSVSNRTTTTNQSMPPSLCPYCDSVSSARISVRTSVASAVSGIPIVDPDDGGTPQHNGRPLAYECAFYFLCNETFAHKSEWKTHCLSHFRCYGPPRTASCPLCPWARADGDADIAPRGAWDARMEHVAGHHEAGYSLAAARPEFDLFRYLWRMRILSDAQYKDLSGAMRSRLSDAAPPVTNLVGGRREERSELAVGRRGGRR